MVFRRLCAMGVLGLLIAMGGCGESGTSTGGSGGTAGVGGTGGSGAVGGSVGTGGSGEPMCVDATDCPPPQFECQAATCVDGVCGIEGITDPEGFCTTSMDQPGRCQNGICIAIGGAG